MRFLRYKAIMIPLNVEFGNWKAYVLIWRGRYAIECHLPCDACSRGVKDFHARLELIFCTETSLMRQIKGDFFSWDSAFCMCGKTYVISGFLLTTASIQLISRSWFFLLLSCSAHWTHFKCDIIL